MISINNLFEGYILNDSNISIDLDMFESGECNKLIIIGLSGGGKTTLGKHLAEKYKCKFIEADSCFKTALGPEEKQRMIHSTTFDDATRRIYLGKMYHNCFKQMLESDERAVIEGPLHQAYSAIPESRKLINQFSSIVLGTSALKSVYQRLIRAHNRKRRTPSKYLQIIIAASKLNFGAVQGDINIYKKHRINSNSNVQSFNVPHIDFPNKS